MASSVRLLTPSFSKIACRYTLTVPFGDAELLRDLSVAQALADKIDQLPLARRQRSGRALAGPGELGGPLGKFGIEPGPAVPHAVETFEQIGGIRIFEDHAMDLQRFRFEQRQGRRSPRSAGSTLTGS